MKQAPSPQRTITAAEIENYTIDDITTLTSALIATGKHFGANGGVEAITVNDIRVDRAAFQAITARTNVLQAQSEKEAKTTYTEMAQKAADLAHKKCLTADFQNAAEFISRQIDKLPKTDYTQPARVILSQAQNHVHQEAEKAGVTIKPIGRLQ